MQITAAMLLLGLGSSAPFGDSIASVISDCWEGRDHSGMSACVQDRAEKALVALREAEDRARLATIGAKGEPG